MATYLRPGVYVEETLTANAPIVGPASTSVAAFIGGNNRGPLIPTLVTSWSQYLNLYGSWNGTNKLPIALFLFFANGGSQAYVQRVVHTGDVTPTNNASVALRTLKDAADLDTLRLTSANPGAWGNAVYVTVLNSVALGSFDVVVYYNGVTNANIVERYTDMTMTLSDNRYAVSVINATSKYVVAADLGSASAGATRNPINISAQALAGGRDGLTVTETEIAGGLSGFDTVANSLVLNAPGVVSSSAVGSLIAYADANLGGRGDVFVVVDPVTGAAVGTAATGGTQLNTANSYTASSCAAVYYPELVINDPTNTTPGTVKTVSPGGAVAAKYITTDSSRGVFKAPAGVGVRVAGAVSVGALTNAELDLMNSSAAPVNAIRFISGSGIVIMGARTLKGGYADMYVPVRRTLIYLRKALTDLTTYAVFEPNDSRLWRSLDAVVSGFLTNFWAQGGLRGDAPSQAFFVKCDAENNPLATIEAGYVNIEIGVSLQRPAEFVVIKIGQFDGGTTITVA